MRTRLHFSIAVALTAGLAMSALSGAQAQIQGKTSAKPVSADALNPHPKNRDDRDVTTPMDVTSIATSDLITQALKVDPFPKVLTNVVYAGQGAPGSIGQMFTPIASSDFNIAVYDPWVVNSLDVKSPSGKVTYNRGVKDQDAGGLNILFTYTPTGAKDPKTINFLQAFSVTTPGLNGGKPIYAVDAGKRPVDSPYYNKQGASGVGTGDTNGVPLGPIADKSNAWLLDTPYICEAGFNGGSGCPAPGKDEELFSSYVDTFDVFIEADQTVKGTNYQVLYGGFEWGFTFTATDTPEASTWVMMLVGFAGLGFGAYRKSVGSAASA